MIIQRVSRATVGILAATFFAADSAAQTASAPAAPTSSATAKPSFVLGPPNTGGPVVVRAGFELRNINNIDDEAETFEFTGTLTFMWRDERQAFDPAVAGVDEKFYQGNFQFNELSPGWFPQEILVNESGMYDKPGVILRVQPDGTSILVQSVNAVAKAQLNMRRFPFDAHRLEAVFEVLGFDDSEVVLKAEAQTSHQPRDTVRIPQWTVENVSTATLDRSGTHDDSNGARRAFVVSMDVRRQSFFVIRLVVIPLIVIVMLSFSVFWMDRSSLGDRINVSFIGILTGVAYQILLSDILPRISYFTLINAFLNASFLTMCMTVVVNLVVGALDKKGRLELGDRVDQRCRWIFPLAYSGLNLIAVTIAFTFY